MRPLLAALGLAASAVLAPAAVKDPSVQTLYVSPHGTIAAFAQDGPLIAWFAPSAKDCNTVHVLSLANGLQVQLPTQSGRNVTCRWQISAPVGLALAAKSSSVLWTLRDPAPVPFDYLLGAAVGDRRERRFQEIAHTSRGAGLWLGGVVGDESTLAYAVTSVDYQDEAGCLAGTATCAMQIEGGGVYRVVGREPPKLIPGTTAAVSVAASAGRIAYIPSGAIGKDGQPLSAADVPLEVVSAASGDLVARIRPQGTPIALALAPHVLATLERTPLGLRLAWYVPETGAPSGSVPVAEGASPELTADDRLVVYHVGRSIRGVEVATHRVRTIARAAATPIGLSLDSGRLAWAENLGTTARIRALYLSAAKQR